MEISVYDLSRANACSEGLKAFITIFPDGFLGEWTPTMQALCLGTELRKYLQWAVNVELLPGLHPMAGWDLRGVNLSLADLFRANLPCAKLRGAQMVRTCLSESVLRGADLQGADLYGADLYGADLRRADLREANLTKADLSQTSLARADLTGANLTGATLPDTYLVMTDLSGALRSHEDPPIPGWKLEWGYRLAAEW